MNNFKLKNDIIAISYYANQNDWKNISKTNYQRILYFSAVLAPIFAPNTNWSYGFNNTIFGPYNTEITDSLKELNVKDLITEVNRAIHVNKVYTDYVISKKGIDLFENKLYKIESEQAKYKWFSIVVKVLSIYGSDFMVKLIKNDPNVVFQDENRLQEKLVIDNTSDNLSKEFFMYIKGNNLATENNLVDEDILLVFFDILYRKYKGGQL